MFTNVGVVCEGQTEAEFIKVFNKNWFNQREISLKPVLFNGRVDLNGNVSIERIIRHINHNQYSIVTTFVDYYGFKIELGKSVDEIEQELKQRVQHSAFIPYLQVYEAETLLFSNIDVLCSEMTADEKQREQMQQIIQEFNDCPEKINNSPETAPSKRLKNIFPRYKKIIHGTQILKNIPFETIRKKCPRFNNWIIELEKKVEEQVH